MISKNVNQILKDLILKRVFFQKLIYIFILKFKVGIIRPEVITETHNTYSIN